jgi:hypothetical protein
MQTRRFTQLPGLAITILFTLLVGSLGADDRKGDDHKLEGTWDVTLQSPRTPVTGQSVTARPTRRTSRFRR